MSHPARGPTQSAGIDGKAIAACRRRCGLCGNPGESEAAA